MAINFRPGDLVEIRFSAKHREEYPAYSNRYHGAMAFVVKPQGTTFVTVSVPGDSSGVSAICIEREFLILREIHPSNRTLSLVKTRKAAS